ncbi:response regulator transcription factor [Streptantibioticus ferralitis]|uniref:Response regulator transcription factor n=1 Tax=Streptantibioticus ferralitis TaxID=236510 RepID=A0ABT5Z4A5_9ACTN|nr:response regulator transcription factor [Streptantibioticus ferralitis]MDF2258655.1 response regulator transcription factor [Streptantibioticus ferralitis]
MPQAAQSAPALALVVEDDATLAEALTTALEVHGHRVETVGDGRLGLERIRTAAPDVVLLDVMLPQLDGLTVCRRVRADGDRTPILMLTARSAVADRIDGLDAGADDYLPKPFDLDELIARVRALLRRAQPGPAPDLPEELSFGDLVLDTRTRRARRGGRSIDFTRTEAALLELLMTNAGQVLTRDLITDRVWGYDFGPSSNSLEVYVGYLRRKLEEGGEPRLVHTVRGVGYLLSEHRDG